MKPPVEHIRVSAKGKEILIKIKRYTGLEHWNEICRLALCHSLANPTHPAKADKLPDSNIDIEWNTFAGSYRDEFITLVLQRANNDGINTSDKIAIANYFKAHLERGIIGLQNIRNIFDLIIY